MSKIFDMLSYRILFIFWLKRFVLIVLAALVFVLVIIWILNFESHKDAIIRPPEPKNDISKPALYVFTPPTRTKQVVLGPGFGNDAPLTYSQPRAAGA